MTESNEALIKRAPSELTEKRLRHTAGVTESALHLAGLYGGDAGKIRLAAACHDIFRGRTVDEINELIGRYGLPDRYLGSANLAHSKIAAAYMAECGIDDEDVLNAVSYHTTGRAGMSLLEKIIFLADAIEPGRDYPGVDELRGIAERDLDAACIKALENSIVFVRSKGEVLDKDTEAALEYLKKHHKVEKGSLMEISSKELALKACEVLSNKKGSDIKMIDVAERSSFTDYLILATGGSSRQVAALSDEVEEAFAKLEIFPKGIEGKNGTGWVLLDFGDVIVNVFDREMREKYSIEKVWGDCDITDYE